MKLFNLNEAGNALASEIGSPMLVVLLFIFWIIFLFWVTFWKGYALWTAAKRSEKWWFLALLLVNTLGILEIFYLLKIAKKKNEIVHFVKKKVLRLS